MFVCLFIRIDGLLYLCSAGRAASRSLRKNTQHKCVMKVFFVLFDARTWCGQKMVQGERKILKNLRKRDSNAYCLLYITKIFPII
uniref:Putative secreted protein n=1 Tax=Anopheles darlingi TaxID=43151 RepID=A0A2M4DCI3_ANODA